MHLNCFISGDDSAIALIHIEAIHLVDSVLEKSVDFVSTQGQGQRSKSEPKSSHKIVL